MSLADELFAELGDCDEAIEMEELMEEDEGKGMEGLAEDLNDPGVSLDSVYAVAKLNGSARMRSLLERIDFYSSQADRRIVGSVESDPEYRLVVDVNNMAVEMGNEMNSIYKFVRDVYKSRFPELDSLVQNSLDYVKVANELGNNIGSVKDSKVLQEFMNPGTILAISLSASYGQGSHLTKEKLDSIKEAYDLALELESIRLKIYDYIEKRMDYVAPNLASMVGASVAAKLIGAAGGLENLSKTPSCNILVMGAERKAASGFSSLATNRYGGFIYHSDLVQSTSDEHRKKITRMIANKCALAARVDFSRDHKSGFHGGVLKAQIMKTLENLQKAAPVKQIKALPVPLDAPGKKRGGKRVRKVKGRLGRTDMRKEANRMTFGALEEDAYQEDLGLSLGNLGSRKSGGIRGPVIDSKTKARISKTLQQKVQKQQTWGGTTSVRKIIAGTASSVSFTPLQGLEVVRPSASSVKSTEAKSKYFTGVAAVKRA